MWNKYMYIMYKYGGNGCEQDGMISPLPAVSYKVPAGPKGVIG